ncbi:flagellar hook-basal body complex protein FliE [Lichenibacterium dinghuense]|uniref:flagellar hook-basal body complex protein FliE n=1 Tax=Lichenibacterium dinghuense TaxID=2895977 RepID=UPI00272E4981|nr:flagellar hook-basal body complex protein FliE [Lichenibacterium sp. 6Y81]
MIVAALPLVTSALSSLAPSLGSTAASAASAAASSATAAGGADFGSVLSQVTGDTVKKMKAAEAASISGIEGKASTQDVVQSVMSAQESLQTALAIRDKSVAAFQEISRMAI